MTTLSISKGQRMGEDIRAAKSIYESVHGFVTETNVKAWLEYANESKLYFKVNSYEEVLNILKIENGSKN